MRSRSRRRSTAAFALVLALVALPVGGCGPGDAGEGGRGSSGDGLAAGGASTTTTGSDADSRPGGAGTTRSRPGGGGAGTSSPTAAPTSDRDGPDATAPAPGSGDVQPTAVDDGSQGPPGAFARTLLRPQPSTSLVLERAEQAGATLAQSAVSRSAAVLGKVSGKPVDVRPTATLVSTDDDWTADEVRRAADGAARITQGRGRAVLRLLVLRGTFEGSEEVLGVAVRGDVVALFADNIAGAATPLVSRAAVEDAVLLHEFGHVLGLVDLARDTGRADKEHPGHSSNSASVMFWAVESSLIGQVINGPPPRDFDAQDLADLRALRDGA